jgi:hypothetical protein
MLDRPLPSKERDHMRDSLLSILFAVQKLISAIGSAFPVVLLFVMCFAVGGALARLHVIHREPEQAFEAEKRTATHESIVRDAKFLKAQEAIMKAQEATMIEQLKVDRAATPKTALIEERIKEREAELADIQKRLKSR